MSERESEKERERQREREREREERERVRVKNFGKCFVNVFRLPHFSPLSLFFLFKAIPSNIMFDAFLCLNAAMERKREEEKKRERKREEGGSNEKEERGCVPILRPRVCTHKRVHE